MAYFLAYGNYDSRVKARTRYMQEALGGAKQYVSAYEEKLKEVFDSGENLCIQANKQTISKKGMRI